jgi:hypothetical protein
MFSSSIQTHGDNQDAPDYVYYNADIINNTTQNTVAGQAIRDPQIRFNETRDTAIIRNAADYYFSIIRFTMDGANRDLPLFIPVIAEGTGQTNVNLTTYSMAVSCEQTFQIAGPTDITALGVPQQRFIQYVPETQNSVIAPVPRNIAADGFQGLWSGGTQYLLGQIVSMTAADQYGSFNGPFYQVIPQAQWNLQQTYQIGAVVQFNNVLYQAIAVSQGITPVVGANWILAPPVGTNPTTSSLWSVVGNDLGNTQDLTSRYYWVYTYQHFVDLWNQTMFDPTQTGAAPAAPSTCAYQDTYNALYADFLLKGGIGAEFPYATFGDFCNAVYPPVMKYVAETSKFDIYMDSAGFGQRLTAFTQTPYVAGPPNTVGLQTHPINRLFFNTNMFGLFANYNNTYYNSPLQTFVGLVGQSPDGYVNEILATNKAYQNVSDFRLTPYAGVAPLGYTPVSTTGTTITPNMIGRVYYIAQQDYSSTDSLWSPVSSIVFTSTLLPIRTEATGQPVVLGAGNIGDSQATAQSAFQPIITDIALDTSQGNADAYRRFIFYAPSAEYRLSDFSSSKQDIRNIDIQVFWKNRLDNQLYPINMFNLSTVSVKIMFKHKDAGLAPASY